MNKIHAHLSQSIIVIVILATLLQSQAYAATINYNNIIDDSIFDNASTMSATQIDSFLNTFPNSCISTNNGFSAPDPIGYNPTNKFTYGGDVSAGKVIYDAAQAYGINPQVLLTTLQKEQGLVIGDGGNVIRPASDPTDCGALAMSGALGYDCPDTLILTPYSGFEIYAHKGQGTASLSGTSVTGSGTTWTNSMVGNNLVFPDGVSVNVTAINSPTSLTVTNPNNSSENGQSYRIQIMSVQPNCVRKASYVGFSRQIIISSWQFTFDRHRSEGLNNWYVNKPNWDNTDDLGFCYSGYDVAGGPYYLCPDQNSHASDPYIAHSGQYMIDSTVVTMTNGSTAALFDYTPHLHGQDLFSSIFSNWFGNTHFLIGDHPSYESNYAKATCNIPAYDSSYVQRLYHPDNGDYLLTTSSTEACSAVRLGYIWDGVVMQSVKTNDPNALPVYRLSTYTRHLYTIDPSVKSSSLSSGGYRDEGIAFYAYTAQQTNTIPVYSLTNGQTTVLTSAGAEGSYYVNTLGFTSSGVAFYTPIIDSAMQPVFRLVKNNERFTTQSVPEKNLAIQNGYTYEATVSTDDSLPDLHNLPVYRLVGQGGHFYTTSRSERDLAVVNYGYLSEGVGWYAPDSTYPSSNPIYRQTNYYEGGLRLYTGSIVEHNNARTFYGYIDEGVGWYGY